MMETCLWPLSAVSDVRHQAFQCPTSVASSGGENTMFGHDIGLECVLDETYSTNSTKKKAARNLRWICAGGTLLEANDVPQSGEVSSNNSWVTSKESGSGQCRGAKV